MSLREHRLLFRVLAVTASKRKKKETHSTLHTWLLRLLSCGRLTSKQSNLSVWRACILPSSPQLWKSDLYLSGHASEIFWPASAISLQRFFGRSLDFPVQESSKLYLYLMAANRAQESGWKQTVTSIEMWQNTLIYLLKSRTFTNVN